MFDEDEHAEAPEVVHPTSLFCQFSELLDNGALPLSVITFIKTHEIYAKLKK